MSAVSSQTSIAKFLLKIEKSVETPTEVNTINQNNEIAENIPSEFSFPYQPYTIQKNFMKEVYRCIEKGKLGIFESPTGTGKSLSLLCASLTWLVNHETNRRHELELAITNAEDEAKKEKTADTGADWFESFTKKRSDSMKVEQLKEDYSKFVRIDDRIKNLREKRQKTITEENKKNEIEEFLKEIQHIKQELALENEDQENFDQDLVLKDYESDDEATDEQENEIDENDEFNTNVTKIFYCSRTHSQLSQFVGEVKRTSFRDNIRVITLSSRQNACINETVLKLVSVNAMNDRCLELQKNKKGKETKLVEGGCAVAKKKKTANGCPYYKQNAIKDLQENILTKIGDIEEIANLGLKGKACPYYASRFALPLAQLVVLPYNTLLNKQTRDACGIKLRNNIVIIDEAHNLLSAICNMHSCEITGKQLMTALSQLSQYKQRFISRLKAKNLFYVQQIIFILQSFLKYLKDLSASVKESEQSVMTLNELVIATNIDNLNLFKILRYCKKSEISRKLLGFSEKYNSGIKTSNKTPSSIFLESLSKEKKVNDSINSVETTEEKVPITSPLMQIEELFRCLTNSNNNGRVVITRDRAVDNCKVKYYLLNPAAYFQDVVSQARSVILAGGTLQPKEEFTEQLFRLAGSDMSRILHFSCGHIVPPSHLLSIALAQGPGGQNLDFSYQNRTSSALLDDLGRAILSVCNVVPGGIVCFLSSYSYAELVIAQLENTKMLAKIDAKKKVFVEPKKGSESSAVFDGFSKCILEAKEQTSAANSTTFTRTGAILFCVVGGKMSEGINFSDDLGRCIIMVGMPYPNKNSPELQEKMKYLDNTLPSTPSGKMPGQLHYEHICMKAVNQSIGRAIRHRNDYATILLLDSRYCRLSVQQALPQWIQNQIKTCQKFGPAFAAIRKFFQEKKIIEQDL